MTEQRAEDVEEERVALVEPAVPEVEPERRGEVVLECQDRGAEEEHEEAVEDEEVRHPRGVVAALDPGVGEDDRRRPSDPAGRA